MQVFDINIGVNGSRQIDVQADYIYFLSGSAGGGDTTIGFRPESGGETVYLKPGQAHKLPGAVRIGSRWTMFNVKNEGAIVGQVLMGEGEFYDNRVSGSVEVIDGGKARTQAGTAFSGAFATTPSAGQFTTVAMFNPSNSGKNVYVGRLIISANKSGEFGLVTNGVMVVNNVGGVGAPSSKRAGGLPSVCIYTRASQAAGGTPGALIMDSYTTANLPFDYKPVEPIMLPPGYGVAISHAVADTSVIMTTEHFEEPV